MSGSGSLVLSLGTIKPGILSMEDKQVEALQGKYNIGEFSTDLFICLICNII